MSARKLTVYAGERDRAGEGFLAAALIDLYASHDVAISALFRGVEGFGAHHRLQTARLLSLSEDLPIAAVAVDRTERIEALVPEVRRLAVKGLVTVERASFMPGEPTGAGEEKLTLYVGRQHRIGGRPAHEAIVALLHDHGVAGATALLGVDGTAHGARQRARFLGRNADVPVMVISVGARERIAAAYAALAPLLDEQLATLERIVVCKRDGAALAPPAHPGAEPGRWQKVMVYAGEQARDDGAPLYAGLVRSLRRAGAAGATVLRGFWGYHGDHAPHGDRFWALRRRVPVVCVVIDTPEAMARWWPLIDAATARTGLVTSELVTVCSRASPTSA